MLEAKRFWAASCQPLVFETLLPILDISVSLSLWLAGENMASIADLAAGSFGVALATAVVLVEGVFATATLIGLAVVDATVLANAAPLVTAVAAVIGDIKCVNTESAVCFDMTLERKVAVPDVDDTV